MFNATKTHRAYIEFGIFSLYFIVVNFFVLFQLIKGTLMQIWKSANIFAFTFHIIKTPFTFWDMRTWDMGKVCLQTIRNNRIC